MAELNEADVVANELERVKSRVPALFDRDDTFFATIDKSTGVEKISARDMRLPLEIRPNGDIGHFDPDGGDMGVGSGPEFDKAVINSVHLKHAVQWTKKSEWATDDKRKAVVNTVRHLLAKAMADFRRGIDSLCMTAGNGVLGVISAVSAETGQDLVTFGTDGFGVRLMRYNQKITYYEPDLSAVIHSSGVDTPITYHDPENKQIRTATTTGLAAADIAVAEGLSGASPTSIFGVPYHHSNASTGTWLGFDRALTPEIRANRVNAGGDLTLAQPRLALNKIGNRVGRGFNKKIAAWMHHCQQHAYEQLGQLVSVINKSASEQNLNLYFGDGMQMAGAPVKTHYSWDKTRIDFIVKGGWGRAEMHPASFYEVQGRKVWPLYGTSGGLKASCIFYITASFNLFVENPAECSYVDGLNVLSGY